jgi:predicted nucleic acid-binding Zn ribbon protein
MHGSLTLLQEKRNGMPIYEFYCPQNHRIYQFYARTLAQGRTVPKCPDNPAFEMRKIVSAFAVVGKGARAGEEGPRASDPQGGREDAQLDAAMGQLEKEFSSVDEADPRSMGRMMRRMAELTGEKMDGPMEEVVRKLEEGADPESLEEELGPDPGPGDAPDAEGGARVAARRRRAAPVRDPKLYDYS